MMTPSSTSQSVFLEPRGIFDKAADLSRQSVVHNFRLAHDNGRASFGKDFGIARLMIVRRERKRDQNRWQRKCRYFRQAGRAGTRDYEISRAVEFLHVMMKRCHKSAHLRPLIIIRQQFLFARAGEVNHLQCTCGKRRQRLNHRLIDAARSLAATHHQQRRSGSLQPESFARHLSIDAPQFGTNGRAGHLRLHLRKKGCALLKSEQNGPH